MTKTKFRCWCITLNEWGKDLIMLSPQGGIYQYKNNLILPCSPKTHIIQFYTGLQDKNNKELYKGDIVCHFDSFFSVEQRFIVDFVNGMFYFKSLASREYDNGIIETEPFEIIGNIYENKELLN
jgi:uncharacterized phage protein (TIGR01671 family)